MTQSPLGGEQKRKKRVSDSIPPTAKAAIPWLLSVLAAVIGFLISDVLEKNEALTTQSVTMTYLAERQAEHEDEGAHHHARTLIHKLEKNHALLMQLVTQHEKRLTELENGGRRRR